MLALTYFLIDFQIKNFIVVFRLLQLETEVKKQVIHAVYVGMWVSICYKVSKKRCYEYFLIEFYICLAMIAILLSNQREKIL